MPKFIIAYFITPHGFGHASRSAAVMEALLKLNPRIRFELFTTSPQELFRNTLDREFGYHPIVSDIGMVQKTPLEEDLTATCQRLEQMLPFDDAMVHQLADKLQQLGCSMVICDIAPLGIQVARMAGMVSVLVENFTWDWIYSGYAAREPRFHPHMAYLKGIFAQADHHIQTDPLCQPGEKSIHVPPISRALKKEAIEIRTQLGIRKTDPMVLVSMGGIPDQFKFLASIPDDMQTVLVIPGANACQCNHPRVRLLSTHSNYHHPDLMRAANVLVAKAGYSTVAEACQCGIPFGYVRRPQSPESDVLEQFIQRHLPSLPIRPEAYDNGSWIARLPELLSLSKIEKRPQNGADQTARYIYKILLSSSGASDLAGYPNPMVM